MTILFYCLKAATFPRLQRRADKSEFFFEQEGTESDYETLRTSGTWYSHSGPSFRAKIAENFATYLNFHISLDVCGVRPIIITVKYEDDGKIHVTI